MPARKTAIDKAIEKLKIPPVRVKADDCPVQVGAIINEDGDGFADEGKTYYLHKGEWVDVIPVTSIRSSFITYASQEEDELPEAPDDDDTSDKAIAIRRKRLDAVFAASQRADDSFRESIVLLSNRVVRWNWTDLEGKALPQPWHRPDVIEQLHFDEVAWLRMALNREGSMQRKNVSSDSPNGSTAKTQTAKSSRAKSSSGGSAKPSDAPPPRR